MLSELFGVGAGARFAVSGPSRGDGDGEARPPAPLLAFPAPAPGGQRSPPVVPAAAEGNEPVLEPRLRRVLDLVEGGEGLEAIARDARLTPGAARAALGRLELLGLVARSGLSGYVRTLSGGEAPSPILDAAAPDRPP